MALVVILAGGGTGGHIFPALALATCIREREPRVQLHFIGTRGGLETRHVPAAGFPLELVSSRPILGGGVGAGLIGLARAAWGVIQALRILRRLQADLVIGVGGYASVPTVAAAYLSRIPTALIEPNARPGRANRLLARFARGIVIQFDDARAYLPPERTHRLGLPVRGETRPAAARKTAEPGSPVRLLVLGGSQGARSINRAVTGLLDRLGERSRFHITHQTGAADLEEVRAAYTRAGVEAELAAFFEDMPERLANADLVVARAGAATCAELCAAGVPSLLVPYPHAADDHQTANARDLERAGAARIVPDAELEARLGDELYRLAGDVGAREKMSKAAARRATPGAAERIWSLCRGWL